LGLRDYARIDVLLADEAFVIDVNAKPHLQESTIGPLAREQGYTYGGVLAGIVRQAVRRQNILTS